MDLRNKLLKERVAVAIIDLCEKEAADIPRIGISLTKPTSITRLMTMYFASYAQEFCKFLDVNPLEVFLSDLRLVENYFNVDTEVGTLVETYSMRIQDGKRFHGCETSFHEELLFICPELATVTESRVKSLRESLSTHRWNMSSLSRVNNGNLYIDVGIDYRIYHYHVTTMIPYEHSVTTVSVPAYDDDEFFI